jgi:hypothetical protein
MILMSSIVYEVYAYISYVFYYSKLGKDAKIVCNMLLSIDSINVIERIEMMTNEFGYEIIAVDFDGTLCESKWPEIGAPNDELIHYLKGEKRHGSKLILWTNRVGNLLNNAIDWCRERDLEFDAVNANLPEAVALYKNDTRKIFAHKYIDDRAMTCWKLPYIVGG